MACTSKFCDNFARPNVQCNSNNSLQRPQFVSREVIMAGSWLESSSKVPASWFDEPFVTWTGKNEIDGNLGWAKRKSPRMPQATGGEWFALGTDLSPDRIWARVSSYPLYSLILLRRTALINGTSPLHFLDILRIYISLHDLDRLVAMATLEAMPLMATFAHEFFPCSKCVAESFYEVILATSDAISKGATRVSESLSHVQQVIIARAVDGTPAQNELSGCVTPNEVYLHAPKNETRDTSYDVGVNAPLHDPVLDTIYAYPYGFPGGDFTWTGPISTWDEVTNVRIRICPLPLVTVVENKTLIVDVVQTTPQDPGARKQSALGTETTRTGSFDHWLEGLWARLKDWLHWECVVRRPTFGYICVAAAPRIQRQGVLYSGPAAMSGFPPYDLSDRDVEFRDKSYRAGDDDLHGLNITEGQGRRNGIMAVMLPKRQVFSLRPKSEALDSHVTEDGLGLELSSFSMFLVALWFLVVLNQAVGGFSLDLRPLGQEWCFRHDTADLTELCDASTLSRVPSQLPGGSAKTIEVSRLKFGHLRICVLDNVSLRGVMLMEMKYTRNKARSFTLINRDKVDGSLIYAPEPIQVSSPVRSISDRIILVYQACGMTFCEDFVAHMFLLVTPIATVPRVSEPSLSGEHGSSWKPTKHYRRSFKRIGSLATFFWKEDDVSTSLQAYPTAARLRLKNVVNTNIGPTISSINSWTTSVPHSNKLKYNVVTMQKLVLICRVGVSECALGSHGWPQTARNPTEGKLRCVSHSNKSEKNKQRKQRVRPENFIVERRFVVDPKATRLMCQWAANSFTTSNSPREHRPVGFLGSHTGLLCTLHQQAATKLDATILHHSFTPSSPNSRIDMAFVLASVEKELNLSNIP
ncbi:uncharacterized protein CLUP02_03161 [Colletotrichum lupini]|uniref:Uncharacterized protein n=1 Tax=Colletotrichum lupini TaxID=145971 RepID=A0A9Q8WCK7_9PEZI|nr:uncharacterized protein CLUP02_03161 [Colletotrichum lupini]UQC77690.1 hypothetical protein CLUP02_03161 [Colletotrichum lupini]